MIRDRVYMTYKIDKLIESQLNRTSSPLRIRIHFDGTLLQERQSLLTPKVSPNRNNIEQYYNKPKTAQANRIQSNNQNESEMLKVGVVNRSSSPIILASGMFERPKFITIIGLRKSSKVMTETSSQSFQSDQMRYSSRSQQGSRERNQQGTLPKALHIKNLRIDNHELLSPHQQMKSQKQLPIHQKFLPVMRRIIIPKKTNEMKNKIKELSDNLQELSDHKKFKKWSLKKISNEDLAHYVEGLKN